MAFEMIWVVVAYTIIQSGVMMAGNILLVLDYSGQVAGMFTDSEGYVTEGSTLCNTNGSSSSPSSTSLILEPNIFYVLQLLYIALHVLWIVGCIILLAQLCTKTRAVGYYIVWYIVACCVFILDVGVGSVTAIDYGNYKEKDGCIGIGLVIFCFRGFLPIVLNFVCMVLVALMMRDVNSGKAQPTSVQAKPPATSSRDSLNPVIAAPIVLPRIEEEGLPTRGVVSELQERQRSSYYSDNTPQRSQVPSVYGYPTASSSNQSQFQSFANNPPPHQPPPGGKPPARPPYVNVAYSPETANQYYQQKQEASHQQRPYGARDGYQRGHYDGSQTIYEDDARYEDFDAVPPPAFPPRTPVKKAAPPRQRSSPPIPKTDYQDTDEQQQPKEEKESTPKAPASSATAYEMRPFSYVNPNFRPTDHLDIESMKSNQVDIVKTLDQEIQNLKEQELVSSSSEAESIIRTAIVKTYLNERTKGYDSDQAKKKKKKKKKMAPIAEGGHNEESSSEEEDSAPAKPKPTRVLEARV